MMRLDSPTEMPQRLRRVIAARWVFALAILAVGFGCWAVSGGRQSAGLLIGVAVLLYNALLARLIAGGGVGPWRLTGLQILLDSLASVAAVYFGSTLTPAVQFLFLFPLFVATLLSPREGLFLTAAVCGVGYAGVQIIGLSLGRVAAPGLDPTAGTLAAVSVVVGALLAAASVNNYLVRTLAGIETELAESEAKYRQLANSLEDEVRQRTSDLRYSNEELNTRHRELLRLREIDAAIHEGADLATVLQSVVDGVTELVPSSQAVIYLREPGADYLRLARFSTSAERRVAAIEALVGRPLRELLIPLREGTLAEYAVRTREPILTSEFERMLGAQVRSPERQDQVADISRILDFHSFAALPLVAHDALIGILALGSRETLTGAHLERIGAFATQAALALLRVRQDRDLMEHQAALEQAYDELQKSQEQVVNLEKMRAIGEMTSGVAHNFNNALMAILGTAQLVLAESSETLPEEIVHRLRIIEQTSLDASMLVQRIRAFSKDEPPQTAAADVNDLVALAVEMTEPRWKHHVDRLESPIHVDLDLRAKRLVEVDASAIREVLVNLILNSVNALPRGGRIVCRTWDEDDQVMVAFRDTGTGMSEDVRQRCFEPFFTTGGAKGTGLGLSVAYGIIQRHRGEIRVTSSPGHGSEFIISLPPTGAAVVALVPDEPALPDSRPVHALVVDDQALVRDTLGEMLEALGHEVTIAADGKEALRVFDPSLHQLVITDWGMPGMSGLQVARAVKSRSPRTPVVLVTGLDATLPVEVMDADEVDTRLQKPIVLKDLQRALGKVTTPA